MTKKTCIFCNKESDTPTVRIPCDDKGSAFPRYVCDSCWEVIAAIALDQRISRLEAQMAAQLEAYPAAKVV
jgi:hypothetical protein